MTDPMVILGFAIAFFCGLGIGRLRPRAVLYETDEEALKRIIYKRAAKVVTDKMDVEFRNAVDEFVTRVTER